MPRTESISDILSPVKELADSFNAGPFAMSFSTRLNHDGHLLLVAVYNRRAVGAPWSRNGGLQLVFADGGLQGRTITPPDTTLDLNIQIIDYTAHKLRPCVLASGEELYNSVSMTNGGYNKDPKSPTVVFFGKMQDRRARNIANLARRAAQLQPKKQ